MCSGVEMGNKAISSCESVGYNSTQSKYGVPKDCQLVDYLNGRYAIVKKFKEGNMGDTWLCQDTDENDRLVVVKSIKNDKLER